jgi:zinc protease
MRWNRDLAVLALLAAASARGLAAPAPPPGSGAPSIAFEKYVLPNGLQVILHVDRKLPIVHVNEWFHVGSKNEKPGRTGFAHLFEHLMFEGSKNAPGKYLTLAEKLGANIREGGVNGTTSNDRTNYFITVPSGNLEKVLWLESDRLSTLTDFLTKENLDHQRDVVRNERREGLENVPYGRSYKLIFENLFPPAHPYSWDVIGSHEDLMAASFDDVRDFFRTYYTPNNLSLIIAGDFDPGDARRLVEKYFGPIPAGPALDRPGRFVPALAGEKVIEVRDRVPQERVFIALPTPQFFEKGDAELDLASGILTDGLSSRLAKALVYDKPLCSDVNAYQLSLEISGAYVIDATARPGVSLREVEDVISAEIARLAKTGPTPEELQRVKTKYEFNFVSGLERIGGFGGKSDRLNGYNTFLGDPGKLDQDLARYRNARAEDVRAAVAQWLDTKNRLLVRFHPEPSGRASDAASLDRSKEPALGADRPFRVPGVTTGKLPNGLTLFVVERPELPKVAVTVAVRAGVVADPSGKDGIASLAAATVKYGTKSRGALEVENALGDLGTSLNASAAREYASVSLEVLKRNLPAALAILSDVVRNAAYPPPEFEREKKRLLDSLSQDAKNAEAIARRVRAMLAYGREHPYGRPARGLPGTVAKIERDDLAAFHSRYWKPAGGVMVFAGDITLAEATDLATKAFAAWSGAPPAVEIPAPRPVAGGKVYLVDRQDAAQTFVSQFVPGPARTTPDYYALLLADSVWGGGFGTRLNLNLREDKGYSYGVFSSPVLLTRGGVWAAGGGVQTDKTKESVVEFVKELKDLAGGRPVGEKELADAKLQHVRGYAQQFETLGRVVDQVVLLWAAGLPLSELARDPEETARTPLEAVNAAAKKYADPGKASLLLVGDVAKIEPGIRELELGEIVRLDAEGNPVGK